MRISGLSSGIDTESIIEDMMRAHRLPLDKITQKKQYVEWQMDDYRKINRELRSMSDNLFDTMMKTSTYRAKTMNISNPDAIAIKGVNAANDFAGTIKVNQLATQATVQSGNDAGIGREIDPKKSLTELGLVGENGAVITIQTPGQEEGKTVALTGDMSLQKALSKISSETGATAFYDSFTGKVALTSKESGAGDFQISGNFAEALGIATVGENAQGLVTEGQNAKFIFNGLETERASNNFEMNGFEIQLKKVTSDPVTFSSAPDVDKVVEAIEKFVEDYNKLTGDINDKIREPKYRSYHPLSAEEKEALKDREVELWEEKARSGTLRNDPTLSGMVSSLRTIMSSSVTTASGDKMTLRDIGITPSKEYTDRGKLQIDKDKLREAILEDPNKIYELFASNGKDGTTKGIAVQYRESIDQSRQTIANRAGTAGAVNDTFTLGRTIKTMNQDIQRFQERLQRTEERYWRQFTAMEKAMQRAQEQSAQLMNSLGGM